MCGVPVGHPVGAGAAQEGFHVVVVPPEVALVDATASVQGVDAVQYEAVLGALASGGVVLLQRIEDGVRRLLVLRLASDLREFHEAARGDGSGRAVARLIAAVGEDHVPEGHVVLWYQIQEAACAALGGDEEFRVTGV